MTGKATGTKRGMLAVALALTTVVAVAVGVSVTTASTKATTTIFLAQSNGQGNPQLQAILDEFMQQPRHRSRRPTCRSGRYANTLRAQLQSGNAPDVYTTAGTGVSSPCCRSVPATSPISRSGRG